MKFLKTGSHALNFSFIKNSFNQATNAHDYSQHIWEYWHKISQWSKENFRRYAHLFQGVLTFVALFISINTRHKVFVFSIWIQMNSGTELFVFEYFPEVFSVHEYCSCLN